MRAMKRAAYILPLLFLLSATCFAQNGVATKVDDYIRVEMQAQQIPGLSLAVIKNGEIVLARGYGLANVEHQVPVKPERSFNQARLVSSCFGHRRRQKLSIVSKMKTTRSRQRASISCRLDITNSRT